MKTIASLFCLVCLGSACSPVPHPLPSPLLVPPPLPFSDACLANRHPDSSSPNPNHPTGPPRALRIGQGTYPSVVDPQKSSFPIEIAILQLAYEELTRIDEKRQRQPRRGKKRENLQADGKQMTFHSACGIKARRWNTNGLHRF